MKKILIIQTAFIGDVILATSLIETAKKSIPKGTEIHCLVRKGNEGLLVDSPQLEKVLIWNKKEGKYRSLLKLLKQIRKTKFDVVINLQRFGATGLLTAFSSAKVKIGFQKNPFSFTYTHKIRHNIGDGSHEIFRNAQLLAPLIDKVVVEPLAPELYPTKQNISKVDEIVGIGNSYFVLAPSSVWFTKQLPASKWVKLMQRLIKSGTVYLIGAPSDKDALSNMIEEAQVEGVVNLAGELTLMESAVLIKKASRTYVNDSAPLHLASAMNAPVTAFFCSTVPRFGFGPLSKDVIIKETSSNLECRPCGLHGFKSCPEGHFKCGQEIDVSNC